MFTKKLTVFVVLLILCGCGGRKGQIYDPILFEGHKFFLELGNAVYEKNTLTLSGVTWSGGPKYAFRLFVYTDNNGDGAWQKSEQQLIVTEESRNLVLKTNAQSGPLRLEIEVIDVETNKFAGRMNRALSFQK